MTTIMFTDTHFGVKNNSITWLNSQLDFINNQLIPYIKNVPPLEKIRLVHLGDVFDSRSTVSTLVATKVREVFYDLRHLVDEFIIIGGNHDYYSPNSDSIDTINLVLQGLGIKLITKEYLQKDEDLFVPWYSWLDHIEGRWDLQRYCKENGVKRIYTHADIIRTPINLNGIDVYSGHTHIPYIKNSIRNLGSCFALDFGDANTPRGFYVLKDNELLFIENKCSIKFHRLYNEDIFGDKEIGSNDYIELYISQNNMMDQRYIDTINQYTKLFKHIWVIPQVGADTSNPDEKFETYDIETITKELIPEELKEKFNQVLGALSL